MFTEDTLKAAPCAADTAGTSASRRVTSRHSLLGGGNFAVLLTSGKQGKGSDRRRGMRGRGSLEPPLTEWVSSRRVASTPGGAGHVCSFTPALRVDTLRRRSASPPGSARRLALAPGAARPPRGSAHAADAIEQSARTTQRTTTMFSLRRRCTTLRGSAVKLVGPLE